MKMESFFRAENERFQYWIPLVPLIPMVPQVGMEFHGFAENGLMWSKVPN